LYPFCCFSSKLVWLDLYHYKCWNRATTTTRYSMLSSISPVNMAFVTIFILPKSERENRFSLIPSLWSRLYLFNEWWWNGASATVRLGLSSCTRIGHMPLQDDSFPCLCGQRTRVQVPLPSPFFLQMNRKSLLDWIFITNKDETKQVLLADAARQALSPLWIAWLLCFSTWL
jgi:hypothetical protein